MSTTPTRERASAATEPDRRNLRWLWIVALIAVIAIAGIVLWLVFSGGDEESTLTFNGETTTYRGPETLQAGTEITITLENNSDEGVQFNWLRLRDEDMTLEEFLAAFQAGEDPVSDGASLGPRGDIPPQSVVDAEYRVNIEGTYGFSAAVGGTDEHGLVVWEGYPAAVLIEVTGD